MNFDKKVALGVIVFSVAMLATSLAINQNSSRPDYTLYLVRHAEKMSDDKKDPRLTEQGQARAETLAGLLEGKDIIAIYSSDYIRTRDTAAPLAQRLGLQVIIYDPSDLDGLALKLRALKRNALVVGHSNTTPQLAEILGAAPGAPIIEASEYDRLYKIVMGDGEIVAQDILRF